MSEKPGTKDGERRCAFFVKKRSRTCRMLAARGSIYCGEHLNQEPLTSAECAPGELQRRRIPCPLDPKHTVFEHLLAKHLKKCNVTKKPIPTCFTANINSGLLGYKPSPREEVVAALRVSSRVRSNSGLSFLINILGHLKLPLSAFPPEQIEQLVAKVEKIFSDRCPAMETLVLEHSALACDLADERNGPSALKHIKQQASILGHLERLKLLSPRTCYLEFGAGRGKLSHCVQKALGASADVRYVLIDRENCRRKMDSYHKSGEQGPRFERLLMDIEHLDLNKLRPGHVDHVVGISKHLCGAATDLTLRCLLETLPGSCDTNQPMRSRHDDIASGGISPSAQTPEENPRTPEAKQLSRSPPRLAAILIALCCHHCCSWPQFVGRGFFERLGLSSVDFHMLCHMSSWAVCGVRHPPSAAKTGQLAGDGGCCSGTEGYQFTGRGEATGTSDCCFEVVSGGDVEALGSGIREHVHTGLSMEHAGMRMGHSDVSTDLEHGNVIMEHTDVSDSVQVKQAGMSMEPDGMSMEHGGRGHGYIPHPKESIGLKCKRLIDLGRLAYLEEHDLDARLVYFVEKTTSLENVLLIATPK